MPFVRQARRLILSTCIATTMLAAPPLRAADPPAPPADQSVDLASKKLLAANGLFNRGLFKLAAQEYSEFLAQYPTNPDAQTARYALGVCLYRQGDNQNAIPPLKEVVADAKFPQRDEALVVLAHCYLAIKDYDKSLAAFDELLSKYPTSKHLELSALNRAQVLYMSGKPRESLVASTAFVHQFPKSTELAAGLYFQALSQCALSDNDSALETLTQLTKQLPSSRYAFDAALLTGQILESQNKPALAIDQYRRMLEMAPDARKPDALYSLAIALYKAAKYDEATRELSAILANYPSSTFAKPARLQLGLVLLANAKYADARTVLNSLVADDPAYAADARYATAQCDMGERKFDAALATLDDLAKLTPAPANASRIAFDRAVCLMELNKHAQAAKAFATFRTNYPADAKAPEAIYRQAYALHKLGQYDQSHTLCVEITKLNASATSPTIAAPAAELDAENLFLSSKYPDAAKAFAALAAAAIDPQKRLLFTMRTGQCAYFAQDYARAIEVLTPLAADKSVEQSEKLQPALFLLGDAQLQLGKNADAAATLSKYASLSHTDNPEAQFKLALAQLRSNDSTAAQTTLAQLNKGSAQSQWVQRGLLQSGELSYKAGKADAAAADLKKVSLADAPADVAAPALYLLAWIDFDSGKYAQAAAKWKDVTAKYPDQPVATDAAFQRGLALKNAGQLDAALTAFQEFAATHPDTPTAARAKQLAAACLTAQGKNEQAAAILTALADSSKTTADSVLYDLAWSERSSHNTAAAISAYQRLLKQQPTSALAPAARTELAELLYESKEYADAADLLSAVSTDKSADPKLQSAAAYRLAWCHEKLGKTQKAADAFLAFANQHPDDDLAPSALLQAALASTQQGKFDETEKTLSRLIQKYPADKQAPVAMLKLGEAQAEQSAFDKSAKTYNDFLTKYPKDPFAYLANFGVGWASENQKKYDAARDSYQRVIDAHNGETAARAQFQIGETFFAQGKFDQAVAALLAVDDVYAYPKWSVRALVEAGRSFELLKQPDQARKQYTQVVTKYKEAPEADMARERLKAIGQ